MISIYKIIIINQLTKSLKSHKNIVNKSWKSYEQDTKRWWKVVMQAGAELSQARFTLWLGFASIEFSEALFSTSSMSSLDSFSSSKPSFLNFFLEVTNGSIYLHQWQRSGTVQVLQLLQCLNLMPGTVNFNDWVAPLNLKKLLTTMKEYF